MKADRTSDTRAGLDRRRFLKAIGALGVGAVAGGALQAVRRVIPVGGAGRLSQTRIAMGTYVTITAIDPDTDRLRDVMGIAFDEMDERIALFNRHDAKSPVTALNENGRLTAPPAELAGLIEQSIGLSQSTGGTFDITVAPVVAYLRERAGGAPMSTGEVTDLIDLIGSSRVEVSASEIRFARDGMGITLDGIAKGYIVDRISDRLASLGIATHLVNAGGDIRTRVAPGVDHVWNIAIEDPGKQRQYPELIEMQNGAVATSGSYEVYFNEQRTLHHIVDPRSGVCPTHNLSVSVIAPSVVEADALSTALFVQRPERGIAMLRQRAGHEGLVLSAEGLAFRTPGWHRFGTPTRPAAG